MKLYENIKGKSVAKKLASIVLSLVLIGSSGSMMQYSSEAKNDKGKGHSTETSTDLNEIAGYNMSKCGHQKNGNGVGNEKSVSVVYVP